jgi:hypothetical protein
MGEWSASIPGRFTPGEIDPGTHWIGGRVGLDDVEKRKFLTLPGIELQNHGHPACNQSLYRLRYPGSKQVGPGPNKICSHPVVIAEKGKEYESLIP